MDAIELCLYSAQHHGDNGEQPREAEAVRDAAWASADAYPSVVLVPQCVRLQKGTEVKLAPTTWFSAWTHPQLFVGYHYRDVGW